MRRLVQNILGISPNLIYRLIGGPNLADKSDCTKVLLSRQFIVLVYRRLAGFS